MRKAATTSNSTDRDDALELSGAQAESARARIRSNHARLEDEVRTGLRDARSLHLVANTLGSNITLEFPKKPYPTSV